MSDSYPTIQETLSPMQREFLGCVEMHLDPPEDDSKEYEVEATYEADDNAAASLPSKTVRFRLEVNDTLTDDVTRRRHMIEFLDGTAGAPIARISHSMKRVESWGGRLFWTESVFEVDAPEVPHERAPSRMVEREVEVFLERIRALDREHKLRPA